MKKKIRIILVMLLLIFAIAIGATTAWWNLPASCLPGYAGTLQIETVGVDVQLIQVLQLSGKNELERVLNANICQKIVDKADCAAEFWKEPGGVILENQGRGSNVIADHSSQNFEGIENCEIGTAVRITRPDGAIENYVVTDSFVGINTIDDLEDQSGGSVIKDNPGGIILYTCADKTEIPVHILILQPILD